VVQAQKKKGGVVARMLSLEQGPCSSPRSSSTVLLSKVFTKAFELRQNKTGKYREHAFLLEELGKEMCKRKLESGQPVDILVPGANGVQDRYEC